MKKALFGFAVGSAIGTALIVPHVCFTVLNLVLIPFNPLTFGVYGAVVNVLGNKK